MGCFICGVHTDAPQTSTRQLRVRPHKPTGMARRLAHTCGRHRRNRRYPPHLLNTRRPMAISLSSLKSTKRNDPPVILLYGVDGIGKTSLAAEFPSPLYLGTEGERPPADIELATPGVITDLNDVFGVFEELLTTEHDFQTVIIDSLDGLEPLVWRATCARLGVNSIEEPGYGRGYIEADTEWSEYLSAVGALSAAGINVVQLAHPEIVRCDSPTSDPYSRYTVKLNKRTNALVRERADIHGF